MYASRRSMVLFLAGLFLICMCSLMLQIMQTRLLSVIAFYYLAFLAISMAMFGMTLGALLVYLKPDRFASKNLFEVLPRIADAFVLATVVSTLLLISTVAPTSGSLAMAIFLWLKIILILVPPYVLAGVAISLAITRSPWPIGLVYGVDLAGAATGCLVVLGLLTWLDGVSALFATAAIGAVASLCFRAAGRESASSNTAAASTKTRSALRHPAVLAVSLALLAFINNADQPGGFTPTMVKGQFENPPDAQQWNSFSRVRANFSGPGSPAMWGPSPNMPNTSIEEADLNIDGSAATAMYRFDGDLRSLDFLKYDVTNLAYRIRNHGRAAVIGVGGGRDMLSAHLFGFDDVTGVELNPIFVDWLTNRFRSYNHLADLAGTRFFVDEARSWFARTNERFDLIEMSLVDTWAATGAGAFSLSENGLYTVQGWAHFLDALTPTGVLTVSRWYNAHDIRETGRLLSLASAALRQRGVERPEAQIYLAGTPTLATIIVGKAPFSAADLARLHQAAKDLGFTELVSPDRDVASPVLRQIIEARDIQDAAALTANYHIDLTSPTDDRPFFFNQLLLTDIASLGEAQQSKDGVIRGNLTASIVLGIIVLLSVTLVLLAIVFPAFRTIRRTPFSLASTGTAYFALIGLGFMFVEIGIIQRVSLFLGHPVSGLAIGLFSIILSTGTGSLLSEKLRLDKPWKLAAWAATLCLFVASLPFWFPLLVAAFESEGLAMRALIALAAIVPCGVLMGFGFPSGMRIVNALDDGPTPWFWAINGGCGVLAASLAVAASIAFSISTTFWIGATCYLLLGPVSVALWRLAYVNPGAIVRRAVPSAAKAEPT